MKRLKIFTWGSSARYFLYFSRLPHDIYLPVNEDRSAGYEGKGGKLRLRENVHEVPVECISELELDCVIYQDPRQYLADQHEIFSAEQLKLPKIYLEHNPPFNHPVEEPHWVNDPNVLIVHTTAFNELMWNSRLTPTRVVEPGVHVTQGAYSGEIERGVMLGAGSSSCHRAYGEDIFGKVRPYVALHKVEPDLGLQPDGDVARDDLRSLLSRYRFFFDPLRWGAMRVEMLEAMACGMPVVALAVSESVTVVTSGINGFLATDYRQLIPYMRLLLEDRDLAREMGRQALRVAEERFNLQRFISEWNEVLAEVCVLARRPIINNLFEDRSAV
ncbi:MAG: glycosyltransferase family 4 protein [Deltaproteobacteria bacterium]|nr:glycosyltransferase family 4 protein [Deltaproteobacteria bacterium]